jgi:hypothetical protein
MIPVHTYIYLSKLCDIPQIIKVKFIVYELRGVLAFQQSKNSLRNTVGNYTTYMKRWYRNWEQYDNLKKNSIPSKRTDCSTCWISILFNLKNILIKLFKYNLKILL